MRNSWKKAIEAGEKYGYQWQVGGVLQQDNPLPWTVVPLIEPYYNHVLHKQLIGGGPMEIVNPILEIALKNLNYSSEEIMDIINYLMEKDNQGMLVNRNIKDAPHLKKEHLKIFKTANDISPEGHVMMVAAITPLISGSVSKTVNLPNRSTIEDIERINLLAWKKGVKAIAIYRDGCKASQPLLSGSKADRELT